VHITRSRAALLVLLLACADTAAAQRLPQLVTPPQARRLQLSRVSGVSAPTQCRAGFTAPPEIGRDTTLVMAPATFNVGDSVYRRNVYNAGYNAPIIRMNRGDRLHFTVYNRMQVAPTQPLDKIAQTNQHYHGMIVTPLPDTGDNVVPVSIPLGRSNRNSFFIPGLQSEGMMWYHPHPHSRTNAQVAGGLAGALIIGDLLASYPAYRGATERVMYVKDTRDGTKAYLNVNGNPCLGLTIAPGERQLWRIGNMTGATWLNLRLGERGRGYRFIVLALDGNHVIRPTPMDSLFLAPGQRAEAIVIGGTGPWGTVAFYSDTIASSFDPNTGLLSRKNPRVDLGTLTTTGPMARVARDALEPSLQPPDAVLADSIRRLLADPNAERFTVHYQLINGKLVLNDSSYNHDRLDHAVAFGRAQEWTLINDTWFLHTFHIHQTDFVVTHINGVPQPDSVHLDNVHLGIHPIGGGKWAGDTVVIRFTYDSIAAGPFVYHCHDLAHEDAGMMANMCVYDPRTGVRYCNQWFPGGGPRAAAATGAAPARRHAAAPVPAGHAHEHEHEHEHGGGVQRRE
jgi:FtsP/CotA-like multicopper oxidase with cupredoxin domain